MGHKCDTYRNTVTNRGTGLQSMSAGEMEAKLHALIRIPGGSYTLRTHSDINELRTKEIQTKG